MLIRPLFPWHLEVVVNDTTDLRKLPQAGSDLSYILVPPTREKALKNGSDHWYETGRGTNFKARALHYANMVSQWGKHGDLAWLFHLDEESVPDDSVVIGISHYISQEERLRPELPRIGQGTITYHRKLEDHPLMTLTDMIRSGSDKGKLYFTMKLGVPWFGLHGSFILIRSDIENMGDGLDLGPAGSMTEDAWLGALLMKYGVRCGWVQGHVSEQCTEKLKDFSKQRRRWHGGLIKTSIFCPTPFRWRAGMMITGIVWSIAPFALVYTVAHLFFGGGISSEVRALANFSLAVFVTAGILGLQLNLRDHGVKGRVRKMGWAILWIVCLPIFSALESAAVAWSLARPPKVFDVVSK
jgi:egghead protein (zeste-white 4 protein)